MPSWAIVALIVVYIAAGEKYWRNMLTTTADEFPDEIAVRGHQGIFPDPGAELAFHVNKLIFLATWPVYLIMTAIFPGVVLRFADWLDGN